MGRAIVRNPKVFLFDEPLSNLDAKLRVQMRTEIKRVHQKVKTTTVYVTHDQVEAMTLGRPRGGDERRQDRADRHAERALSPSEDAFRRRLHRLAGDEFPAGQLESNGAGLSCGCRTHLSFPVPESRAARYRALDRQGADVRAAARAHHRDARPASDSQGAEFTVTLDVVEPMGMETMVFFRIDGTEICGRVEPSAATGAGETMPLRANLDHMHLIDPATSAVL